MSKLAVSSIRLAFQLEHDNRLASRVDDPILRDASLGVFVALGDQVPARIVLTDDLYDQIGSSPIDVLSSWVVCITQHHDVGFSDLARPEAQAQRCKPHGAANLLHKGQEDGVQKSYDGLMHIGWHGQHLQASVREFHQAIGLKLQELVFTPGALVREKQRHFPGWLCPLIRTKYWGSTC